MEKQLYTFRMFKPEQLRKIVFHFTVGNWSSFCSRIPNVTMTRDEGGIELDVSDDPYDFKRLDVTGAPVIVTVNKVTFLWVYKDVEPMAFEFSLPTLSKACQ